MTAKRKVRINTSLATIRRYFPKVEVVKDAMKAAVVEVTADDNNNADVKNHLTCALAIACKRSFDADGVIIGLTTSWVIKGRIAYRYHNSGTTSREITSFDRHAGFDTGMYLLSPAAPGARLGTIRSNNPHRGSNGNRKGKPFFRHFTRNVRASLRGDLHLPK